MKLLSLFRNAVWNWLVSSIPIVKTLGNFVVDECNEQIKIWKIDRMNKCIVVST